MWSGALLDCPRLALYRPRERGREAFLSPPFPGRRGLFQKRHNFSFQCSLPIKPCRPGSFCRGGLLANNLAPLSVVACSGYALHPGRVRADCVWPNRRVARGPAGLSVCPGGRGLRWRPALARPAVLQLHSLIGLFVLCFFSLFFCFQLHWFLPLLHPSFCRLWVCLFPFSSFLRRKLSLLICGPVF